MKIPAIVFILVILTMIGIHKFDLGIEGLALFISDALYYVLGAILLDLSSDFLSHGSWCRFRKYDGCCDWCTSCCIPKRCEKMPYSPV